MALVNYNIKSSDKNISKETLQTYDNITKIIVMSGYENYIRNSESIHLTIDVSTTGRTNYTGDISGNLTFNIVANSKTQFTTELLKTIATVLSNKYLQKELLTSEGMQFRSNYSKPVHFLYEGLTSWLYVKLSNRSLPYLYINILQAGDIASVDMAIRSSSLTLESIAFDLGSGISYNQIIKEYKCSYSLGKEIETLGYVLDTYYNQLVKDGNVTKLCYIALLAEVKYIDTLIN